MSARPRDLISTLLLLLLASPLRAQFPAQCDNQKQCIGRAIELSVTSGRNAHFIEVSGQVTTPRQRALSVEMWVLIDRQAGKRQFVGGLWGPNFDVNDQWALYVDESDQLCFELNPEGSVLRSADNTVVKASYSPYYGTWTHIAAVFDGSSASAMLYIDGQPIAGPVSNATYPVNHLNPMARNDLPTLIGSTNIVADDGNLYRTMKGWVDEVRIWSRALTAQEILCRKESSLNGNEAGLEVYYRCNEAVNNVVSVCDATGKNHTGMLRSGATNKNSTRQLPRYVTVTPSQVTEELKCDSTFTWTFTIVDTSICGSSVTTRIRGPEAGAFSVTPRNLTLQPGVPQTITVTFSGTVVGTILDTLQVSPTDRCGYTQFIKINVSRITELSVDRNSILYDTLLVGCREVTYHDSTITLCNTTDKLGQPRTVTISNIAGRDPQGFRPIGVTFPIRLAPGQCTTIVIRRFVRDTTNNYRDTLKITSDDRCQNRPAEIAVEGRTQEVISITNSGGTRRIDTLSFQATCPGQSSAPQYYTWQNLTLTPLRIDSMGIPKDFFHYRVNLPFTLQPATGYQPLAVRFRPLAPGPVFDSIVIRTKIGGCTIERVIYVRGRGLDNKVEFTTQGPVDFGNVLVGQQRALTVQARNTSLIDALTVSLYVERGDAFTLLAGTSRTINPGATVNIPVTFIPTDSLRYNDRLCLFETRCYTVDCIELTGKGVLERFRFSPLVMETENVIACRRGLDTVCIVNISGSSQTISSLVFTNPSGRFRLVDPPSLPPTMTIANGDSVCFVVEYIPNDVTGDRADRAYIRYKSDDGEDWQVQLIGTSATPKVYVTRLTAFGTVEVGDTKRSTVVVENTSSLPVLIDSLTIGNGFTIVSTSRPVPIVLQPRDSIAVEVDFVPTASMNYSAKLTAHSSEPCLIKGSGDLEGRGVIIELESALSLMNFGYVRPCDCAVRMIEMLNGSLVFPMTVDSVWIDAAGIPNGKPQFFSWRSKFSPTGTLPYTIPPTERDSVYITFCPNTPADTAETQVEALFHVQAHGSGWSRELETYLFGKRSLTFTPFPRSVIFPAGVVDVLSPAARTVNVTIPSFNVNPSQDTVVIDSITFTPDERVFFITNPASFPVVVAPGQTLTIQIRQRPRAPRSYQARMTIHYSKPCKGTDTTVLVRGAGFAQPKGLSFSFDPKRVLPDTFTMVSCDTLVVPIYSSSAIDASVVDVFLWIDFDTTQLRLLDVMSPLLSNECTSATGGIKYTPTTVMDPGPPGVLKLTLKNFCGIDSVNSFAQLRFVTVANNRVNSRLNIDSVEFDTEDVLLYQYIATGDKGTILAFKSEIDIARATPFDSVRILDCAERDVVIYNIGDVANSIDALVSLPMFTSIVASNPPAGTLIQPGDSAVITIRFCPRAERSIDTMSIAVSSSPCDTRDTAMVTGYGYAPELDVSVGAMAVHFVLDTLGGTIGDTIEIPIMLDNDVKASYNGQTYWLNGLNVTFQVLYEPRSLKYLDAPFLVDPLKMTVNASLGSIDIVASNIDSLAGGEVARLRYLVTVPELTQTDIIVSSTGWLSDSLQFLDIVPSGSTTPFITSGKCDITNVSFSTVGRPVMLVYPNPATDVATIRFRMQETVPVYLRVFNASGTEVAQLMDGTMTLRGGEYEVRFETSELPAGVYHLRIDAGVFTSTQPCVVVK